MGEGGDLALTCGRGVESGDGCHSKVQYGCMCTAVAIHVQSVNTEWQRCTSWLNVYGDQHFGLQLCY
mgnify:CR=1 FL=1